MVFSEYRLKTGELPTSENMLHVCSDGLKVTSLYWKFRCLDGEVIPVYYQNASGKSLMVAPGADIALDVALSSVWIATSRYSDSEIAHLTTRSSVWMEAMQEGIQHLFLEDAISRLQLRNAIKELR